MFTQTRNTRIHSLECYLHNIRNDDSLDYDKEKYKEIMLEVVDAIKKE